MVSIPPMLCQNEVPLKTDTNKKFNIDWELIYPNINFNYVENKNDKNVRFTGKLEFNCLLEKFGIPKDENVNKNVDTLINTISKCFSDNKVTIEPWQQNRYYAIEFKGEEDKTLFKVYLKDD